MVLHRACDWTGSGWKGLTATGRAEKELAESKVANGEMGWACTQATSNIDCSEPSIFSFFHLIVERVEL